MELFRQNTCLYNIVTAHIPGRANYNAEFLSRREKDKTATMFLKLTDRVPIREIEIAREAQNPDVEMNLLLDTEISNNELNGDVSDALKK